MGPTGPFFMRERAMATTTFEKERKLQDEIGSRVEHDLPGVEVLAVELANPERFVDSNDALAEAILDFFFAKQPRLAHAS